MLCRLAICNYHKRLCAKDNAEFDVTGNTGYVCPVVCVKANYAFIAHIMGYVSIFTWVSLC